MPLRQTTGSVVCPSCGKLVGVNDPKCWECGRPYPGMFGYAPLFRRLGRDLGFVQIVTWSCVALFVATLISDTSGIGGGGMLGILSPSRVSLIVFGAAGPGPVLGLGRWWTVLSAGWLHGGLIHILFNVLWIRQLGPQTAAVYGAGRMVIIYVLASVTGFVASSLAVFAPTVLRFVMGGGHPYSITVGASAAIFGLLGALIHYGRRGSSEVGRQAWIYAIVLFAFGLMIRGVDNWAHLGGLAGGWLVSRWLDPMKPERGDHLLLAIALLVASLASVVASYVTGLRLLP
ncbi:MAG TPA: rhomboid family intramembrane serine protease [Thermoanaerobaculia bacterium]|nr:rhomboid family intramembrane serine protease [Thermoanaerobaculia bacterium]